MLKLQMEKVPGGWKFKWPKEIYTANELFYEGVDYLRDAKPNKARECFRKALRFFPEHIDSLNSLSNIVETDEEAEKLINLAVKIGLKSFSRKFKNIDKLEWGWLENRAFLRAYYNKALMELGNGNKFEAIIMLNQVLFWNPNDNQGAREVLAEVYVKNGLWEELIYLWRKYSMDYILPSLSFGVALALYKKGMNDRATKHLTKCIKYLPKCANILLKKKPKKPKEVMLGYISIGGYDQAYEFWKNEGKTWRNVDTQKWLAQTIKEIKHKDDK